ncbi:hypothetical protein Tco_1577466 [Tanacetum coccineum]
MSRRYGYMFRHLKTSFMPRKDFKAITDGVHATLNKVVQPMIDHNTNDFMKNNPSRAVAEAIVAFDRNRDRIFDVEYLVDYHSRPSFDVIIGMDWLAYHQALFDCYEKIVRIPLPNGKILKVQGERPEKDLRSLACIKADEKKLDYIHVVRDFPELQEVHFLGHVVNHDGIHVDPSKVEYVKNWKTPESSTEIRSFLGLAGFWERADAAGQSDSICVKTVEEA